MIANKITRYVFDFGTLKNAFKATQLDNLSKMKIAL